MHYIYEYELASFVIMLALLLHIRSQRQVATRPLRFFLYFLVTALAEAGLNVVASVAINAGTSTPRLFIDGVNLTFFIVEALCRLFFFLYICALCGVHRKTSPIAFFTGVIPAILLLLFILSNPWTHFIYHLDSHNAYILGPYASVEFASYCYYLILTFAVAYYYRDRLQMRHIYIIAEFTLLSIIAVIIEYLYRPLLLTSSVNALVLLNIYGAMQDPKIYQEMVTGFGNWRAFSMRIMQLIRKNKPFGVICIDLNTNRSLFNVIEYSALIHLEESISNWISDHTQENAQAYYLSVQRCFFLVTAPEHLSGISKDISARFSRPWTVQNSPVTLSANIFVESYPENFSTFEGLCGIVHALRLDNKISNGCILWPDDPSQKIYRRSLHIRKVLEAAIENDTVEVYYQPIVDVSDGRPCMLEALARLRDNDGSFIPPDQFITIAEQSGLIYRLQQCILDKICIFCRDKLTALPKNPIDRVHVNLSVLECMQPDMADRILNTIERNGLPPKLFSLELTERMALVTPELMKHHMSVLTNRGVSFSLDDYGTGNANISYIIEYNFDTIKFDRSLMHAFFTNEKAHHIIGREFLIIKDLGLNVIAEGIETEEEMLTLKEHHIQFIQGYYYSRPIPPDECIAYLEKFS